MTAIVTGSQKFGKPTKKSDIDLVVRVEPEDVELLRKFADEVCDDGTDPYYSHTGVMGMKFGKLHLLLVSTDDEYNLWVEGTRQLAMAAKSPKKVWSDGVPRKLAIEFFDRLRELRGVGKNLNLRQVQRDMEDGEEEIGDEDDEEVTDESEEVEEPAPFKEGDWVTKQGNWKGDPPRGTVIGVDTADAECLVIWQSGEKKWVSWNKLDHATRPKRKS